MSRSFEFLDNWQKERDVWGIVQINPNLLRSLLLHFSFHHALRARPCHVTLPWMAWRSARCAEGQEVIGAFRSSACPAMVDRCGPLSVCPPRAASASVLHSCRSYRGV